MKLVNQPNAITSGLGLAISRRGFLGAVCGLAATAIGCESMYQGPQLPPDTTYLPPTPPNNNVTPPNPTVRPFSQLVLAQGITSLPARYTSSLADYQGQIFLAETSGGGQQGDRNHIYNLNKASSFLELTDGNHALNNLRIHPSGNQAIQTANDGFYDISLNPSPSKRFVSYPSGKNFGGGAIFAQNKLAVATANGTVGGNGLVQYGDGTVLFYDVDASGIQESSVRAVRTSGKNSTGVALRNGNTLVVLNSGDYGSGQGASLDLIDIGSEQIIQTIFLAEALGGLTAQVSGKLTLTRDGGTAVIGSSSFNDQYGRVLFVNLNTQQIVIKELPGTTFHSNIEIDESLSVEGNIGIVSVTDFNAGNITILDLVKRGLLQTLSLGQSEAGPAILVNGKLIQTIPYGALEVYPE